MSLNPYKAAIFTATLTISHLRIKIAYCMSHRLVDVNVREMRDSMDVGVGSSSKPTASKEKDKRERRERRWATSVSKQPLDSQASCVVS